MRLVAMMVAAMAFMVAGFAVCAADEGTVISSESPGALLAQAQAEADAGHNSAAKDILVTAVAAYPYDIALVKLLGDVDYRTGDYNGAVAAYEKVLAVNPNDKDVHNRLGGVYAAQDKYQMAIDEFRKSLPLSEGFANLIQLYLDEDRLGDLEAEETNELMLAPFDPKAHFDLGLVYYYEKKYDQSMAQFESALSEDSHSSDARNGIGMVDGELGRHAEAINEYKTVIAQDPTYANAWINWGVELITLSDYKGAIEKLNHALELKPNYAVGYGNLGVAYDYLGDFTQAVELYERSLQLDPREREAYENLGSLYFNHDLLNLAEAAFIKGLSVSPHMAELHFNLGVVYEQQQKYDLAAEQYKEALSSAPNNVEMRQQLAEVQAKLVHQ